MVKKQLYQIWMVPVLVLLATVSMEAQSYRVQCPAPTTAHPRPRCMHLSGGDGFVTMADAPVADETTGRQQPTYIFGFSSLCRNNGNFCTARNLTTGNVNNRGPLSPGVFAPMSNNQQTNAANGNNRLLSDPADVMSEGVIAANESAPTIAIDEDDDFYLTLSNVAMAMRPDLFDGHSVHWHGFAQAASIFDGLPDASIAVVPGASITYYYKAADAGTYMYHCHVEAAEHMQMGMLGNLYVRPRQNRLSGGTVLQNRRPDGTVISTYTHQSGSTYAYNDNDGSTRFDVEYAVQMAGFDPDFHQADLTFQPLPFSAMNDRYFLLNGRSYPETTYPAQTGAPVGSAPCVAPCKQPTVGSDGIARNSQPLSSLIRATRGQRVLLRISNLSVTQFSTLATIGIPMNVIGIDARLLRDDANSNLNYMTNSITIGGGQTLDAILDTASVPAGRYYLYTTNLHHLANDATNFGGMMTEIQVCSSIINGTCNF